MNYSEPTLVAKEVSGVQGANMAQTQDSNMSALWQGMTLKKILEEVDLSSILVDNEMGKKEAIAKNGNVNPEAAFLGPKIWSRASMQG